MTPSFILTLPLECTVEQKRELDKMFRLGNHIYNSLMSDRLKALQQIERRKDWKRNQAKIAEFYIEKKKLLAEHKDKTKEDMETLLQPLKDEYKPFLDKRQQILQDSDMTSFGFQKVVKKYTRYYKGVINSIVGQKIAADVWNSFKAKLYGNGKDVRFKPWTEFNKIEGKNNDTGLVYRDSTLVMNNKLKIKAIVDYKDTYACDALKNRVKYCRVVRKWNKRDCYYQLQLVLEGFSPLRHKLGSGRVGIDIGTQTVAVVADNDAVLVELADRVKRIDKELKYINRSMDNSRKINNPIFFNDKGEIVTKDKLPPELLTKRGKRKWKETNNYKRLAARKRYLYAKQAETRRLQHKTLANRLLLLGNEFYIEDMNFKSLAKRVKETKKNDKGKNLSKKRFGKSISNKAPALFVTILSNKVTSCGGTFTKIKTHKAKASQYNHLSHEYNKKKLSKRWNNMPDGKKIQRDLYSAFLIKNINPDLSTFNEELLNDSYTQFCANHDKEIARLKGAPLGAGIKYVV